MQLRVFGKVNLTHPARGELLENSVVGNRSCGHRTFLAPP